jgi:peptidoglycan/xylan/chitin deacetylase (PgdA/CDA1 family)
MSSKQVQARRLARARARQRSTRGRLAALGSLALVIAVIAVIAIRAVHGTGSRQAASQTASAGSHSATPAANGLHSTVTGNGTGTPGTAPVPILMYHVIAAAPPDTSSPSLYVPDDEFTAQMQALKAAGWHAVTLDQVEANWTRGVPLGTGKPIVISFDNGYHSQYANALPVLQQLGWVGDENLQLNGLPPSEGGLTGAEIRGLVAAGWELDSQGIDRADLVGLGPSDLQYQVATARETIQRRFSVPVNWFSYPSGDYDSTVVAEVKAAGYVGSTTVVPGWATPAQDRYLLPRIRVVAGTTPQTLLAQIAATQSNSAPPDSYTAG